MSSPTPSERVTPRVLIVGAGLGGLMLAILFEKMGDIEYFILERASSPKPLGNNNDNYRSIINVDVSLWKKRRKDHQLIVCDTVKIISRIGHVLDPRYPGLV